MKAKVYGCRGSYACSHTGGSKYGGNTSCMVVAEGGASVIIDAGSGLAVYEKELTTEGAESAEKHSILISHLHLDHIIGLPVFAPALTKGGNTRVFTCQRDPVKTLTEQLLGCFKPPYWPVDMASAIHIECIPITENIPFQIETFTITPFLACHGNKTLSFAIQSGKKRFVHLLDNEVGLMSPAEYKALQDFCSGADLVVFDAAYSAGDYENHRGWGHSTAADGVKLARECEPKRMLFSHFSQKYSDAELDGWKSHFDTNAATEFIMSYDGLEIEL